MLKENAIIAYVMRVNEKGQQYQGYLSKIILQESERKRSCEMDCIYENVVYIDFESPFYKTKSDKCVELIAFSKEMVVLCRQDAVVMGLPLNRAMYGENGKFITILAGDIFVVRRKGMQFMSVCQTDIERINQCLQPIIRIFGGKIYTKSAFALPEWIEKNET